MACMINDVCGAKSRTVWILTINTNSKLCYRFLLIDIFTFQCQKLNEKLGFRGDTGLYFKTVSMN